MCVYVYMYSGVYWGASTGLPPHNPHTTAAAGPDGCPGSQTAAVWRLNRYCGATQHYCCPGKHSSAFLLAIQLSHLHVCANMNNMILVPKT